MQIIVATTIVVTTRVICNVLRLVETRIVVAIIIELAPPTTTLVDTIQATIDSINNNNLVSTGTQDNSNKNANSKSNHVDNNHRNNSNNNNNQNKNEHISCSQRIVIKYTYRLSSENISNNKSSASSS